MEKIDIIEKVGSADTETIGKIMKHLRNETRRIETVILGQVDQDPLANMRVKDNTQLMVRQLVGFFLDVLSSVVILDSPGIDELDN